MSSNEFVFRREDCIVIFPQAEYAGKHLSSRAPRVGMANASKNGTIMTKEDENRVTIIHPQTDISVTEDRFIAYRNKELAFQRLEVLVNRKIEELLARRSLPAKESEQTDV